MGHFFEENIKALRNIYPNLADKIEKKMCENKEADMKIEAFYSKNGLLNFRINVNNHSYILHSNYDPIKESIRWVQKFELIGIDTITILGIGAGYHVERLIENYPNKNKIIIEPNLDILVELIKYKDITHIINAPNTLIIVNYDFDEIAQYFHGLRFNGQIDNVKITELDSYINIYGEWWDAFKMAYIKHTRLYQTNLHTNITFTERWFSNFFENIKQFPNSVLLDNLEDKFKGIPAIIVSAGPSLNKNIELLKQLRERAVIIACGSAVNILESKDIIPHMMVGVDALKDASEIFNSVKSEDIYFAYTPPLHYEGVRNYKGPKLYYKTNSMSFVDWFEKSVGIDSKPFFSGASVANISIDIADFIGCSPIILVGQDSAYTDMQIYAEGAVDKVIDNILRENIKNKNEKYLILEKDIYGNPIYTAQNLLSIKLYVEKYVKLNPNANIINCTEGGLPIEGVDNYTLKEIAEEYFLRKYDVDNTFKCIYKNNLYNNTDKLIDIKFFIERVYKEILCLKELSSDRLKLLYDLSQNPEQSHKKWSKLDKLTDEIEKNDTFIHLILPISYNFIQSIKNSRERNIEATKNPEQKRKLLYEALLLQYGHILDNVNFVDKLLEEILKNN